VSPADGKDTSAASDLQKEIHSLAFGVRFLAGALAVALGAFNIGVSLYLPIFHRVFNEALPGLTLPFPTGFIMEFRMPWIIVSIVLPVLCVILASIVRSNRFCLVSISLLIIVIAIQDTVAWTSLIPPLLQPLAGTSATQ
jgi:hypothetical protein